MTPCVKLYVVRHGETDWNAERRYQGQADIPLNGKGRLQAAGNGATLKVLLGEDAGTIDYVASPLVRARETMQIIRREIGLEPEVYRTDPALMELNYGHWQGVLQAHLPMLDPTGLKAREKDPLNWRPRGGESYADLLERTRGWLQGVQAPAVVVAHGGTIRTLLALYTTVEPARIPVLEAPQNKVLVLDQESATWT